MDNHIINKRKELHGISIYASIDPYEGEYCLHDCVVCKTRGATTNMPSTYHLRNEFYKCLVCGTLFWWKDKGDMAIKVRVVDENGNW